MLVLLLKTEVALVGSEDVGELYGNGQLTHFGL
jgi:hypothetical protein